MLMLHVGCEGRWHEFDFSSTDLSAHLCQYRTVKGWSLHSPSVLLAQVETAVHATWMILKELSMGRGLGFGFGA